jgi:hypothetical protein
MRPLRAAVQRAAAAGQRAAREQREVVSPLSPLRRLNSNRLSELLGNSSDKKEEERKRRFLVQVGNLLTLQPADPTNPTNPNITHLTLIILLTLIM